MTLKGKSSLRINSSKYIAFLAGPNFLQMNFDTKVVLRSSSLLGSISLLASATPSHLKVFLGLK